MKNLTVEKLVNALKHDAINQTMEIQSIELSCEGIVFHLKGKNGLWNDLFIDSNGTPSVAGNFKE